MVNGACLPQAGMDEWSVVNGQWCLPAAGRNGEWCLPAAGRNDEWMNGQW